MLVEEIIAIGLKEAPDVDTSLDTGAMPHEERAAARPIANASVFKKNDTYLEVCGQFEAQRGMFGFAVCVIPFAMIGACIYALVLSITKVLQRLSMPEDAARWEGLILFVTVVSLTLCGLLWFSKCIVLPLLRKDYFTTRRTLIRFHRVTRKVYVHQPPHAGGINTYDWDDVIATLDDHEPEKSSGRLVMGWVDMEAAQARGLIFVGRAAGNAARGRAWWEYIRRYMEEGPDTVPTPRLRLWKGVWPHMSLLEIFYLYPERLLHGGPLWWILLPCLAPIDLARAALHWIAMLLCVEPKFPPEIEFAGIEKGDLQIICSRMP
ncbi:DUF6708 domain-containing protein [Cupriavidus sp. SW-Y-13]|uniref:DUF6708 domain-containing protein n=1 Tax=Cupriavidus sp. SW-Y-13 TaxID=2653854 RepID=UPI0013653013|nr:DUF6708 domain-containing protein [Cupriavidus sp. SW-Y-13]MWL90913.1 hypothetical protein [Cupriavidus sp. SW-Y-13]